MDLRLCAATFALDLRTSRQSERRLFGDELRETTSTRSEKRRQKKKRPETTLTDAGGTFSLIKEGKVLIFHL